MWNFNLIQKFSTLVPRCRKNPFSIHNALIKFLRTIVCSDSCFLFIFHFEKINLIPLVSAVIFSTVRAIESYQRHRWNWYIINRFLFLLILLRKSQQTRNKIDYKLYTRRLFNFFRIFPTFHYWILLCSSNFKLTPNKSYMYSFSII